MPQQGAQLDKRLKVDLDLKIRPQPNGETCGPTCLHALYRFYKDPIDLDTVIREVPTLPTGGTLGGMLACHALRRGYRAKIYSYNLQLFDPTWFGLDRSEICERLKAQRAFKDNPSATARREKR